MRESAFKNTDAHENQQGEDGEFLIVRNYRQIISKNRRKLLRKVNNERKRIMQMMETESQSPIVIESSQPIDHYYEDEPWDILMDDSDKLKSVRSSTDSFPPHEGNPHHYAKASKGAPFTNACHEHFPKNEIFSNSFPPFIFYEI